MKRVLILALILALLSSAPILAQVITGTILGTVTDPSGAVLPRATVAIRNTATNISTTTSTTLAGDFVAPYLPPGPYEVRIEAPGFKTFLQSAVTLTPDSKFRVDAALALGETSERVEVVSSANVLQADSSEVSSYLPSRQIQDLPNIGRNPLQFAETVAGIVPRTNFDSPDNVAVDENSRQTMSNFSVNGSQPNSSEILLDGAPDTGTVYNEVSVIPSMEAIGDMKVITNAYSAEFGRVAGGVISFGTKSGGQEFHGALYEYVRNPVFNANTFGNNSFGTRADGSPVRPRGAFQSNQFGGSLSGRVTIPKIYEHRDRTFFFVSYEGLRRASDASSYVTVPTALERQGDFSQTRAQVRNPATGANILVPRDIYIPYPSTTTVTDLGGGSYRLDRQQAIDGAIFNKIPQRLQNPVARTMLGYYPLPNITPLQPDGTQNYYFRTATRARTDQIIVKVDNNDAAQKHYTFIRFTNDWTLSTPPNLFADTHPAAANNAPMRQFNPSLTIGHTWSISGTSILDIRANAVRSNINQPTGDLTADFAGLGFSQDMIAATPSNAFPSINAGVYPNMGMGRNSLRNNHFTNYAWTGSYTKILSRLTLKFGGDFRVMLSNMTAPRWGSMGFSSFSATQACSGAGCPSLPFNVSQGWGPADFLVGAMNGGETASTFATGDPSLAVHNSYMAFYTQNDWKISPKLTLNLGARWEVQPPLTERYDRLSQFNFSALNATGTPGLYEFAGVGGNSRRQRELDLRNWGPRIGFAWRVIPKTVIRSAYGISYAPIIGQGYGPAVYGTDGFSAPAYMDVRPQNELNIVERPFNEAFVGGGVIFGPNANDPRYLGLDGGRTIDRHQRTPYIQQWNFTLERELPGGFMAEAAYVGTKGTRLIMQNTLINGTSVLPVSVLEGAREQLVQTGLDPLAALVPNPFYGKISTLYQALSGPTVQKLQLYKPYPAYGALNEVEERYGSSSYNGLQLSVQRHFGGGSMVSVSYAWSKSIDFGQNLAGNFGGNNGNGGSAESFSPNALGLERSVSGSDVPQLAAVAYTVELPFGTHGRFLTNTPIISRVLAGWKTGAVATFSSGLPLGISGGGFGRPDLVGDPVLPKQYRCYGDGKTACPLPDGSTIVVPAGTSALFQSESISEPGALYAHPGKDGHSGSERPVLLGQLTALPVAPPRMGDQQLEHDGISRAADGRTRQGRTALRSAECVQPHAILRRRHHQGFRERESENGRFGCRAIDKC